MGDSPRAGYYSYAWIERLLGMDIENSHRILPAYQRVEIGEALDRAGTMTVLAVEPYSSLVLGPPATLDTVRATWVFALYPVDDHRTRLVTRVHGDWSWRQMLTDIPPYAWPFYLLTEPGAFVMERKMLLEIRKRAEATPPAAERVRLASTSDGTGYLQWQREDGGDVSDVQDLAAEVEACWRTVRQEVEGIELAAPVYPNPLWTARDLLIHCAFWNDEATKAIQAHLQGEAYVTDTGEASLAEGLDAMNGRVVEAARSLSEDEVWRRWIAAQDRFTDAVRSLDAAAMAREIACPWDERKPVPDMVRDELAHETGHINDVVMAVSAQEEP